MEHVQMEIDVPVMVGSYTGLDTDSNFINGQ